MPRTTKIVYAIWCEIESVPESWRRFAGVRIFSWFQWSVSCLQSVRDQCSTSEDFVEDLLDSVLRPHMTLFELCTRRNLYEGLWHHATAQIRFVVEFLYSLQQISNKSNWVEFGLVWSCLLSALGGCRHMKLKLEVNRTKTKTIELRCEFILSCFFWTVTGYIAFRSVVSGGTERN